MASAGYTDIIPNISDATRGQAPSTRSTRLNTWGRFKEGVFTATGAKLKLGLKPDQGCGMRQVDGKCGQTTFISWNSGRSYRLVGECGANSSCPAALCCSRSVSHMKSTPPACLSWALVWTMMSNIDKSTCLRCQMAAACNAWLKRIPVSLNTTSNRPSTRKSAALLERSQKNGVASPYVLEGRVQGGGGSTA